ncbi:uncharacterized protein FIESC28_03460 [Fusarium coffeatum]|uniref:Major facilitator superfamily (MFS) profile domain-containing protein n=1 Tax=Fusarium coffeatum TaxID=231269 RepID=A0A366S528_9HYPO|nr:uncharacterized protein FIESC28_03460 [Fusarium coffeatum]RBR23755.1 hypothetical protein FIESC28_03460 [Fusarium coffeatum]
MEQRQTHEATRHSAVAQVDAEKCVRDPVNQGRDQSPRDLHGWKWALSYTAMLSTTFLFALDNTIVADIQPAIIQDLGQIELLPWVGTGFALGTMVVLPLSKAYGILSIRSLYLANILLFEAGSALCGAAPNMNAMILGRVIAGVGGAGMYAGTLTYVAVSTTMKERGAYMAGSTVVWGIGTVLGPVVGGAFAESSATWRWSQGFYINLVVGAVFCPAYLFLFPSIDPQPGRSLSDKLKMMDWPMTLTFLSGSTFLIMAISFGGTLYSWHSGAEIAFWTLSGILLVIAALLLRYHPGVCKEDQLWPARFLKMPVVMNLQLQVFLSGGVILTITYYIPLYFQFIRGDGPLDAGVRLLPLVISMIVATIVSGLLLPKTPYFSPWYIGGSMFVLIGTSLMYTIDEHTDNANIYGYSIMVGFGAGCYVVIGFTILQSLVPSHEISNAVAVMTIAQNLGMVLFLSLCGTIFQNTAITGVGKALPDLPKDQVSELIAAGANLSRQVQDLQARLERAEVQLGTRRHDAAHTCSGTRLPLLMPLLQDSVDSNVLTPHSDSESRSVPVVDDTTFETLELGFDELLQLDPEQKLCWEAPIDTLLQSVNDIDPSLLINEWPSDSGLEVSGTIPMADIMTPFTQEKAPLSSHSSQPEPSLGNLLPELYRYFFKYVYNSMPIICETRFLSELSTDHPSKSITALKYSVALLSTAVSIRSQHLSQELYALVRRQIEDCEMDPDTTAFSNLNVFQALLFLVRLSSVLRLHRMDSSVGHDDAVPGLHISLPVTDDQCLLEERRRSFWLLFVWETYIKTRSGMESQLGPVSSFHVKLPSPGRLGPEFSPANMPFLAEADRLTIGVSPFCACLLMVDLAMKCLNKKDDSNEGQNVLEECYRHRMHVMQGILVQDMLSRDPIALTTNLNMGAIKIILHNRTLKSQEVSETAMEKVPHPHDTAMSIFTILKESWEARLMEGSLVSLQATFLAWPLATAINTIAATQQPGSADDLMELFVILGGLEPEGGYWHTFTREAGQMLRDSSSSFLTMSSPLETLPTELLDEILVRLPTEAAVNLWKSNARMSHRLDNHLFGQTAVFNRTKVWACKRGDVEVLRAAIARDGDPNFVMGIESRRLVRSESKPSNWPRFQLGPDSTLRIVIGLNRAKALDALLEMGATFEVLGNKDRIGISNHLLKSIGEKPPKMLEALTRANLGHWVLNTKVYSRTFGDFVKAGAPVGILRSIVQNPSEMTLHRTTYETPLSSAIDLGKSDIVNMLMEKGADINGVVEEQPLQTTFVVEYYKDKMTRIKCRRPCHVPIFAAARYMARSGSTKMLDLCLHHGADINQKSPATESARKRIDHFNITPLMAYLEAIPDFPTKTELDPIAGIKYFISNGADIQVNESPGKRYFGSTMWLNVSTEDYCIPRSIVEVLFWKWGIAQLQEPQFLDTIKYLIAQGSGISRADTIVVNLPFDSIVMKFPPPQRHTDHPDNVPMWRDAVQRLWDKLDEVHGHSYAWLQHSFELESEARSLIAAGIRTQEERDRLLYRSFNDLNCLYFSQHYVTLPLLVLDRQIDLGADINSAVGDKGESLLFYVCDQINNAFITGEIDTIESAHRHPENVEAFHVKLQDLVLSLIDKGADPRMPINDRSSIHDSWTPLHVLRRDTDKATSKSRRFLLGLVLEIEKARDEFLGNGSTPSVPVRSRSPYRGH